jgi:nitrogen fixation/metabolism regulation signal transduction histidine kinase
MCCLVLIDHGGSTGATKLGEPHGTPHEQHLLESILACLTNGVIAIDASDRITIWNAAAGSILHRHASMALGKRYQDVFNTLPQLGLIGVLNTIRMQQQHGTIVRTVITGHVPGRGQVTLHLCVCLLADTQQTYLGMVIVIDDRTPMVSSREK